MIITVMLIVLLGGAAFGVGEIAAIIYIALGGGLLLGVAFVCLSDKLRERNSRE